jgi:hypothetical protein
MPQIVESAATGHPRKPMSREQLEAKFFECTELAISVEQAPGGGHDLEFRKP